MDNKIRLLFSKTGKAIYMSHLDLMATMQRSLLRTGIKLQYSQGFNPHPVLSIALPLSVGYSSLCELIDFKTENYLLPDGLPDLINEKLPDGIKIIEAYIPLKKFNAIKWIQYEGKLYYNKIPDNITCHLADRFSSDNIIIHKKTKRGVTEINIAPHFRDMCYTDGETVTISVKLSAQDPTINPGNLLSALNGEYEKLLPEYCSFTRINAYDADLNIFK